MAPWYDAEGADLVRAVEAGTPLPIADPAGVTIESYDNEVKGGGTISVATFPADATVLAWKIAGDAHPRFMMTVDPTDYGAIFLGDGTVNPIDAGSSISGRSDRMVMGGPPGGLLEVFGQLLMATDDTVFSRAGKGPVLLAPNATKHRIKVANDGTLSTETVT